MLSNKQIEAKVVDLARAILSDDHLASFLKLPLEAQLVGIATLSHIGSDADMCEAIRETLKKVKNANI